MVLVQKTTLLHNIYQLIYPDLCLHCEQKSNQENIKLCTECWINLKSADLYKEPDTNRLEKMFWGRVKIEGAYTAYIYQKDNVAAHMIHALKYKNKPQLGLEMGKLLIEEIQQYPGFTIPDALIPMPLHPKKQHQRGYNQSYKLCEGISELLPLGINTKILKRKKHNVTQTKKHQFERWENVMDIFEANENPQVKDVLLVDDVVTTGATLEAAAHKLIDLNYRVKIATFAITTQD